MVPGLAPRTVKAGPHGSAGAFGGGGHAFGRHAFGRGAGGRQTFGGGNVHNETEMDRAAEQRQRQPQQGGGQASGGQTQSWITVAGGKHIPIGQGQAGGQPQTQPQQQQQAQSQQAPPAQGQGAAPQSEADLPADVKRQPFTWSSEKEYFQGQRSITKEDIYQMGNAQRLETMQHGPYYEKGELHIPSTVFHADKTPKATAEWKQRGLRWDPQSKTWHAPVPLNRATDQVRAARAVFDKVYGVERDAQGKVNPKKRTFKANVKSVLGVLGGIALGTALGDTKAKLHRVTLLEGRVIPQRAVLSHILAVNPPGQVQRGDMTPVQWAARFMTPEPHGYLLMDVSPEVMNIPAPVRDPGRVDRYAEEPAGSAPPIVVDANKTYRAVGPRGLQEHTVIDGRHRLMAALERGDERIRALVPARLASRIRAESEEAWRGGPLTLGTHPPMSKAEGTVRWITVGGKHIPIREGGGEAERPKEEEKPQEQAAEGDELTHADRVKIAGKLAAKLGLDPSTVQVSEKDEADNELGAKVGEYDPKSGKITLYPASFAHGRDELIGTLSHEAMHAKFAKVAQEYSKERKAYQAGESLLSGKIDLFKQLNPVFSQRKGEYERADGQSSYDKAIWGRYQENKVSYATAVNETLAETSRLEQAGQGEQVHSLWRNLARAVSGFAQELGA